MSDLTKRMREAGVYVTEDGKRYPCIPDSTFDEAIDRIEQLEAALRELVEAQEALELALLDGRSGEHDFGALNGRVINAWDKARALIEADE